MNGGWAAVGVAGALCAGAYGQRFELRKVWVTGDAVPGTTGVFFQSFGRPSTFFETRPPDGGFVATLSGPGVTAENDTCVFRTRAPAFSFVALREGDQVPGLAAGVVFDSFERVIYGEGAAALARVRGTDVTPENDRVLVKLFPPIAVIARTGTSFSPLPAGVALAEIGGFAAGSARTVYFGRLTGTGVTAENDQVLVSLPPSGPASILARTGELATGVNLGLDGTPRFADLSVMPPAAYGVPLVGETNFFARLTGPYAEVAHNRSYWRVSSSGVRTVVAHTPGTGAVSVPPSSPVGVSFVGSSYFRTSQSANGPLDPAATLVTGTLTGPTIAAAVGWTSNLVGVRLGAFDPAPVVNTTGSGPLAVVVTLAGTGVTPENQRAVWMALAGNMAAIAVRAGDQAPGAEAGVKFADFAPLMPGTSQVPPRWLFRARLTGPGVTAANDEGVFVLGSHQNFANVGLVAREGDAFEVAPGDSRTIAAVWPTLGWDDEPGDVEGRPGNGRGCAFNDGGQALVRLTFTDGTQAIAWSATDCLFPAVVRQPESVVANEHATVTISAEVNRLVGGSMVWQRNGVGLSNSSLISGANTPTLTIRDVKESDEGVYTLRFVNCLNTAGTVSTAGALLTVNACRVDVDRDGARTVDDIFLFLNLWFARDARADFDGVGGVGIGGGGGGADRRPIRVSERVVRGVPVRRSDRCGGKG